MASNNTTNISYQTSGEQPRQTQMSASNTVQQNLFDKIKSTVIKNHLIIFFLIIISLQFLLDYFSNTYGHLTTSFLHLIPGIFDVIIGAMSYYEYIVGGIIAASVSYFMVYFFNTTFHTFLNSGVHRILFQALNIFIVIALMIAFSAVSAPSLAYSFTALTLYPKLKYHLVTTYIITLLITSIMIWLYFYVFNDAARELRYTKLI